MTKIILSYFFFLSHVSTPYAYANKYDKDAKKFVEAYNEQITETAKNAVVSQFINLGKGIFFDSVFSSQNQDILIQTIDKSAEGLIVDASSLLSELNAAQSGTVDIENAEQKIHVFLQKISALSNKMQRLSWGIRDYMDKMYGANDWMLQAISGFQNRCSLGYYTIDGSFGLNLETQPEVFKSDLSMFINLSVMMEDKESKSDTGANYVSHNEVSLHPTNYGDIKTIRDLQEAQKITGYSTAVTGGIAINLAANSAGAFLGANVAGWGTAAAASFGAGVAIAVAIYVIGSFEAYNEQKKWARSEVYKFLHSMDSDDFSRIYRDECIQFNENLDVLKNQLLKLQGDKDFRASIMTEVNGVSFGECRQILANSDLNANAEGKFQFSENNSLAILKYYQCTTQVHGPKMFSEITNNYISQIASRLNSLQGYMVDYISIVSNIKNDFSYIMPYSADESDVERLYKNLVVAATGVILGLNTNEDYFYNKSVLLKKIESVSFKVMDKSLILKGIEKIESHVKKYI